MPSDMCVALAALDAVVQVQGPGGERSIPFVDFHLLPADHPARPQGVAWLSLTPRDPDQLRRWLGEATPPLRLLDGPPGLHQVCLQTASGRLILP